MTWCPESEVRNELQALYAGSDPSDPVECAKSVFAWKCGYLAMASGGIRCTGEVETCRGEGGQRGQALVRSGAEEWQLMWLAETELEKAALLEIVEGGLVATTQRRCAA